MRAPAPALLTTLLALAAPAFGPTPAPAQPLPSSVVAYTGQTAPGTGGATYFLLYQPTITADGDVAFRAEITGAGVTGTNHKGHWRQSGGGPVGLFVRAGDATPLPGTTWSTDVGDPSAQTVSGSARAGFFWGLLDGVTPKGALWSEQPGGLRAAAVQGDPAPGIPGATFQPGLPIFDTKFDEQGELLFPASVTGGGSTPANDQGLWLDDGATTMLVVREGDAAPGFPAGTLFPAIQGTYAKLSPGALVTFWSNPFVPALGLQQTGIWSNRGGSLAGVILQGQSAPGLGGGETVGPGEPYSNRYGQIAFVGSISGGAGGYGVWISDTGGSLSLAVRQPGLGAQFQLPGSKATFADDGAFYMITNRYLAGTSRPAIVQLGSGGWHEIAHQGERVADLNAGVAYGLFDQLVVNGYSQVALRATITGPGVTTANNKVLVAQGADLEFHLVARTGDLLEVAPGVFRTITSVSLTQATSGGPGPLRGMGDNGALVWIAGTGGISTAILVTQLSVPPSIELVGLEAVQAVQDWNGSLPLVAGKRTYVRAHLESITSAAVVPLLRARPAGGGPDLPLSPLKASNPGGRVAASLAAAIERGELGKSAYWELPSEWTMAGAVELQVLLLGRPLDCLESAGPIANDCTFVANFATVPRPEIRFVSIDHDNGVEVRKVTPQHRMDLAARLVSALPTDGLVWSGSSAQWPVVESDPDTCFLYKWLYARKILDKCLEWEGCRTLYYGAVLHDGEVGCSWRGGYAGAGYLPASPTAPGRHTHTHELGHILGLNHSVDSPPVPLPRNRIAGFCSEDAPAGTLGFPYIHEIGGQRRPTLGPLASGENAKVFGFDTLQRLPIPPDQYFELMSYCSEPVIDLWPSKPTYEFLKTAIEARFALPPRPGSGPSGATEVLLVSGAIDTELGTASFDPFLSASVDTPAPAPDPGPYTLRVHRTGGAIEDTSFAPEQLEAHNATPVVLPFFHLVDSPATVASVELLEGVDVLAAESASANAPTVQLLAPNGGEILAQPTVDVSWAAGDTDGDLLVFVVQFSPDGGSTWKTLENEVTATSATIDRAALTGTTDGRFRIQASDGLRTASDDSDGAFTVTDNAPQIVIVQPANGQLFYDGQALVLEAMTLDPEDGALAGAALTWSSSLDGVLGTGTPLTLPVAQLGEGLHVLTLAAQDSAANVVQSQIQFRVDQPVLLFEDDFESGGVTLWQ